MRAGHYHFYGTSTMNDQSVLLPRREFSGQQLQQNCTRVAAPTGRRERRRAHREHNPSDDTGSDTLAAYDRYE